jgi:hypothetical protein
VGRISGEVHWANEVGYLYRLTLHQLGLHSIANAVLAFKPIALHIEAHHSRMGHPSGAIE